MKQALNHLENWRRDYRRPGFRPEKYRVAKLCYWKALIQLATKILHQNLVLHPRQLHHNLIPQHQVP